MTDLELMRWKCVGLSHKQLKYSLQTVFLNSVFTVRTAGFLGLLITLRERTEKEMHPFRGVLWSCMSPWAFACPVPLNMTDILIVLYG
jgi:hypothetical protein